MQGTHVWRVWCSLGLLCLPLAACGSAGHSAEALTELTASEAVRLLCSHQVSAVQYARALLQRAGEVECLNSYAALDAAKVLEAAAAVDAAAAAGEDTRPLCGLAVAIKDNIDVAGYETVAGLPAFEGYVQSESSPLIARLEAAHGVVLGKTRMHELAWGVTSISPRYGAVLNPYQVNRHVGGSSGGTAALVAARGAAVGLCTDTGGSCRIPAALTGIVGYRPTSIGPARQTCYAAGDGLVPMTTTRDTVGLMARSVADIKLLDTILSACPREDRDVQLQGLRLGLPFSWWQDLGEETEGAFAAALNAIGAAGVQLVEFDIALLLEEQRLNAPDEFSYVYEMPRELSRYIYTHGYNLSYVDAIASIASPPVREGLQRYSFRPLDSWPSPQQYLHMLGTVTPEITRLWNKYFDSLGFDAMLVPSTPITARPINAAEPVSEINGRLEETLRVYARTAEVDCPSAVPGLSIPIGLAADGLPIGLQLHSRPGDDGTLLSVGEALEAVLPKQPPPPRQPACQGCTATTAVRANRVEEVKQTDGRQAAHAAALEASYYSFRLEGQCRHVTEAGARDEL